MLYFIPAETLRSLFNGKLTGSIDQIFLMGLKAIPASLTFTTHY